MVNGFHPYRFSTNAIDLNVSKSIINTVIIVEDCGLESRRSVPMQAGKQYAAVYFYIIETLIYMQPPVIDKFVNEIV